MASPVADSLDDMADRLRIIAEGIRAGSVSLRFDTAQRMELAQVADNLTTLATHPADQIQLQAIRLSHIAALRLFHQWRAFEKIPPGEGSSITYAELAGLLDGDVSLITRICRILVANHTLRAIGSDRLAHTEFSELLIHPQHRALMAIIFDTQLDTIMALPSYFEHFGRIEPTDRRQTPLVFAAGKLGSTAWEVLHSDETKRTNFMLAMAAAESMPAMQTGYDFSWIALEAAQSAPDRVVCVDVGGGKGHALKRIMRANPTLPRHRFALEDLPDVLEQAGREDAELDGVQLVPIDFHLEQPIKGALVYHIRRCLHDYSDGEAVLILQRIAAAMARDSKLLVLELVVEDPPTAHQAMTDLMVMSLSGKERTLADWRGIVGRAGLTITRVSTYDGGHSVIECALA